MVLQVGPTWWEVEGLGCHAYELGSGFGSRDKDLGLGFMGWV